MFEAYLKSRSVPAVTTPCSDISAKPVKNMKDPLGKLKGKMHPEPMGGSGHFSTGEPVEKLLATVPRISGLEVAAGNYSSPLVQADGTVTEGKEFEIPDLNAVFQLSQTFSLSPTLNRPRGPSPMHINFSNSDEAHNTNKNNSSHSLSPVQIVQNNNHSEGILGHKENPINILSRTLSLIEPTMCDDISEENSKPSLSIPTNDIFPNFDLIYEGEIKGGEIEVRAYEEGEVEVEPIEEEPIEEILIEDEVYEEDPMAEEVFEDGEYDLDMGEYLEQQLDPSLLYHQDRVFSDNSDSRDVNPREPPGYEFRTELRVELKACADEMRTREEEEEAAYQSALNDPLQAHLFDEPMQMVPVPELLQVQISPPRAQVETQNQTLRRSARIIEKGATKKYSEQRTKARKCGKSGEEELDPFLQAQLLHALKDDNLATEPLLQISADQADFYCDIVFKAGHSGSGQTVPDPTTDGGNSGTAATIPSIQQFDEAVVQQLEDENF